MAHWQNRNRDEALRAFQQARQIGLLSGDFFNGVGAVFAIGRLLMQRGRLHEALALCREVHHSVVKPAESQGRLLPVAGVINISNSEYLIGME